MRQLCITTHCERQCQVLPRNCKSLKVLENFYMDDYLDSVESPEKAINRSKELVHLLHLGGFKLTKFVSNVPNLADRIDGSPQSTEPKVIVSCQEDSSHVLGLKWDHTNDTLVVSRGTSCAITKSLTQRLVLSLVSKVFDPIGLVAPFTVGARPHWSRRTVYRRCATALKRHLACHRTTMGRRAPTRHGTKIFGLECGLTKA